MVSSHLGFSLSGFLTGLAPALPLEALNVDKLKAEYQELMKQKSELTSTYKDCEKEVRELKRKQENLNQYLGRTQPDPAQDQQEKKDTPNL